MGVPKWALAVLVAMAIATLSAPTARAAPYSSHSQIYACCTDPGTQETMFAEAKASGAAYIRVAFEQNVVAPDPADDGRRDWSGTDRVAELSRRFQLPVVAVLVGVSYAETTCPGASASDQTICPPRDPAHWGQVAGEVAARYAGLIDHFEIWNEPDGRWAFRGQPEDYAWLLSRSYDAIKARAPGARVVLGGTMYSGPSGNAWLERVFATPGPGAAAKFDIGTVHLRGPLEWMLADLGARRQLWSKWGRTVPTWVTEHGYPSDPTFQAGAPAPLGEPAQASYLARTLPALGLAGADQIFVTLRDGGEGPYSSEGILAGEGRPGEAFRRKLAWQTVLDATRAWPAVFAWANRPPPVAFRSGFLLASARARQASPIRVESTSRRRVKGARPRVLARSRWPLTRFDVKLRGRFAGRGCSGRVQLTYQLRGARRAVRATTVDSRCGYRVNLSLGVPSAVKLPTRLRIDQRFLGTETTAPGAARPLTVKLAPRLKVKPRAVNKRTVSREKRALKRPRRAP